MSYSGITWTKSLTGTVSLRVNGKKKAVLKPIQTLSDLPEGFVVMHPAAYTNLPETMKVKDAFKKNTVVQLRKRKREEIEEKEKEKKPLKEEKSSGEVSEKKGKDEQDSKKAPKGKEGAKKETKDKKEAEFKGPGGYWEGPLDKGTSFRITKLKEDSPHFIRIKKQVESGSPLPIVVTQIETLQNDEVWKAYEEKRKGNPNWREQNRFHGTPPPNVPGICKQGLLPSQGGVWTASNSGYSVPYAYRCSLFPFPVMYMFMAKVLLSEQDMAFEAYMAGEANRVYPEFLITFAMKRNQIN